MLAIAAVSASVARPCPAQQRARLELGLPTIGAQPRPLARATLATLPDSVRRKVGYHHWTGAAVGGGVGALGGLLLGLAAHDRCSDCSADDPELGTVILAGAGLGGAFGFLVGLAAPKYRWVPAP